MSASSAAAALPVDEVAALDALYADTDGVNWIDQAGWNGAPGTECQRTGVTCDAGGTHVTAIDLSANKLNGVLPVEFWDLTELTSIKLQQNNLQGTIDPAIGLMSGLSVINFGQNAMTGTLPAEIGDLSSLVDLLLDGNQFSGSIPSELGDLSAIHRILLGGNALTGSIPLELDNATTLKGLSLENNQLTGAIPDLSSLDLEGLNLKNNQLTGSVPSWVTSMTNLVGLRLSGNQLTGTLPTNWSGLQSLVALEISHNQLTGTLPMSLSNLAALNFLGLSNNLLTGSIPTSFGALSNLTHLDLAFNQLTGAVPSELGDLQSLIQLNLGRNALSGQIPAELGDLANLELLAIYGNALTGALPTELEDLSSLEVISLGANQLSGAIPPGLFQIAALRVISMGDNQFTGSIPDLSALADLESLSLESNQLSGSIPALAGSVNLRSIRLSRNQLTGSIPFLLDDLDAVTRFDVSFNQLTGSIPTEIGGMSALVALLVNNNQLTGSIPSSIGQLSNLETFAASTNQISGVIPAELNQLTSLVQFNVIHNRIDGEIPFIGDMAALEDLFFSANGITGIDDSVATLSGLVGLRSELNRLSTGNASVASFLETLQPGWQNSQTVAPENPAAQAFNFETVSVSWDPILYQGGSGGYLVSYGTSAGGPYPFTAPLTANKTVSSALISGLQPETTYYLIVQSQSDAHVGNQRTLISPASVEVSATTPDDDLLAHWPLDEASGTTAFDITNLGHDGTVVGSPVRPAGQLGGAYEFDGGDYVVVADPGVWDLDLDQAMTLALWVRADRLDTRQMLMSKDHVFELELGATQNFEDHFSIRFDNATVAVSDSPLTPSTWHHVAITWDGSTIRLYLDGVPDGSLAFNGPLATANDLDFGLGARPPALIGATLFFDGAMDDARIYGVALSDAGVAALYTPSDVTAPLRSNAMPAANLPLGTASTTLSVDTSENATCRYDDPGTAYADMANTFATTGGTSHSTPLTGLVDLEIYSIAVRCVDALGNANAEDLTVHFAVAPPSDLGLGLLGSWTFDEGVGCTAADDAGLRDGTLGGDCVGSDVPGWIAGRVGNALQFDGDDRVSAAGTGVLTEVTLSAWVRASDVGGFVAIVDQRESGADGFNLFIDPSDRLFMRVNGQTAVGMSDIADGEWHHVAGTYDGQEIALFVDGIEEERLPMASTTLDTGVASLEIGGHFSDPLFSFDGDIDEVRVYDRGLGDYEILDIFKLAP